MIIIDDVVDKNYKQINYELNKKYTQDLRLFYILNS